MTWRSWSARTVFSTVASALLASVTVASCNLVAGLDKIRIAGEGGGGEGGAMTCNVDVQCDDKNPCTADSCGADKVCVHGALDGVPAPDTAQTPGDCQTIQCVQGEAKSVADDNDVGDDGEDCTFDSCKAGQPSHTAQPDGAACVVMGTAGSCKAGLCGVECKTASDCPTMNPCVTPSCDAATGKCVFTNVPDGTMSPGVTQPPGDCHVRICAGGMDVDDVDDSDVPVTATDCDTEVCNNGVPSNPPKAKSNPCSTHNGSSPGFCDGAGTCEECATDSECPGAIDDCKHPACVNFACTTAFMPVNTPVAQQMTGDCHIIVCDGAGGTKSNVDDTDLPVDANACTNDICTNGVPSHTSAPDGTGCGTALACLGGNCTGCTSNSMCTAPSTCGGGGMPNVCGCTPKTCAQLGKTCGLVADGCGGTINCNDNVTDGTESDVDCGGSATCSTKCAAGKKCNGSTDCASGFCADGVCCNSACTGTCQACSAAKKGTGADGTCGAILAGADPDSECADQGASSCGNNGSCDGAGACQKYASGTVCTGPSCMGTTYVKPRTCNGTGTCVTPTPSTLSCTPYTCTTTGCTTSCANDTQCASGYYCSGGACFAKKPQGTTCAASNECSTGFCVDGYCCGTACNTACQACAAALKASGISNGSCGAAKNGASDPRGQCSVTAQTSCGTDGLCSFGACEMWGPTTLCQPASCTASTLTTSYSCDGAGNCNIGGNTQACAGGLRCNSSGTACLASCGTADATGDANCVAGYYCDGMGGGACQIQQASGSACTRNAECQSGVCNTVCL